MTATRRALLVPGAVIALALCVLTGCGGSSSKDASAPTAAPSSTAPASPTASTSPSAASTTTAPSPAASSAPPSTPAKASIDLTQYSLAGFVSPSKNIGCLFSTDPVGVRCDLAHADWHAAKPADCHLDYGDSVFMDKAKARLTCHGDTVFGAPHQVTLAYGQSARFHDILCTSQTTGVTCNDSAGHGFTVSRESYTVH